MGVGLWDLDIEAGALLCDDQWHDLLKLPHGSITTLEQWRRHVHPDDVDHATAVDMERLRDMMARDERYHIDFRVIRSDGEVRWWRSVACIVPDLETAHCRALGFVTDVTEYIASGDLVSPVKLSEAVGSFEQSPDSAGDLLSSRELECLRWVSQGKTAWETAVIIGRSRRTIEFHLVNAVRKLSASNKIHAAAIAVRRGLI